MAAQPSSSASTGDTKFDASQYAFFGNNAVEEVELGGLEDDDGIDAGFVGPGDEEYPSAYGRDMFEDEGGGSFTGVDDLAGAFSKPIFGAEPGLNNESRWSQPPHLARFADSRLHRTSSSPQQDAQYNPNEHILGAMPSPLHRTSSYPQQEPQYSHTEPIPVPKSSFIPYPPSGAVSHSSPGQPHNMNMPSPPTSFQMPVSAQNELHHPQFPRGGMPPGPLGRSMAHLDSAGLSTNNLQQNALNSGPVRPNGAMLTPEPMLAARITIEDGLCLLLDVDDIDRLLQFSQQQDGGLQLRNRRQALLEQLAESLQLVDPLTPSNNAPLSPNDDLGRKLLSRYLELVSSGSELARIACMAIFRHLRFIFGNLPSDSSAVETTTKLATAVSTCVVRLELSGLSACLAAIVCSSLQPPLRPLGHAAGDGASFIIKSVLDRATELLTDQHVASTYSMQNRALWQASFLQKYCMSKFDSVIHALQTQPAVAAVIGREMPVELLRASLPHTNEYQRKQLLGFAQRTVPVNNHSSHGSSNGPMTSESIPSSESWKI
uniref:mRNA decay factor PAT1 domain-containing protein n=1 Tax=Oryza rufipogon TaxID=4529 RepID=A0A0E0NDD1_ORYRU